MLETSFSTEIKGKVFEIRQPKMKQVIEVRRIFEKYDFDLMEHLQKIENLESEQNTDESEQNVDKSEIKVSEEDRRVFWNFCEKAVGSEMGAHVASYALIQKGLDVQDSIPKNKDLIHDYFLYDWEGGDLLLRVINHFLLLMFRFISSVDESPSSKKSSANQTTSKSRTSTPEQSPKNEQKSAPTTQPENMKN